MNNKINIPEFKVSEFNRKFKDIIETNFNYVRIKGEISEIKTATKGQIYLTLKDTDSILSNLKNLKHTLALFNIFKFIYICAHLFKSCMCTYVQTMSCKLKAVDDLGTHDLHMY